MSCYRHLPFAVALLACVTVSQAARPKPAAEAPATPAPAAPAPGAPVPPYELKNRSAFANPNDIQRAPFWPIGWVKRQAAGPVQVAVAAPVKVVLDAKYFKVTSILVSNGGTASMAVINGRSYAEGENVRLPKSAGLPTVHIRVQRIVDGSVILQNADQTIVAPLQRPELSNRKPEELLIEDKDK